jgi:carbonic anhydrase
MVRNSGLGSILRTHRAPRGHTEPPINITQVEPSDLPALKLDYQLSPLSIIDNGHTIQVKLAPGSILSVGDKTYTWKQFPFHHPSEVHVKGKVLPFEAHLFHQDSEGHLAVVAVPFEEGRANPLLETLWKNIPTESGKAENVPSVSVEALHLLPADRGYFTFAGSSTTPPRTEGVTWYEFKSYATVSREQVAAFAKISPTNARPIQPALGRKILQSK